MRLSVKRAARSPRSQGFLQEIWGSRGTCCAPRLPHKGLRSESSFCLPRLAVGAERLRDCVSFCPSDLTAPNKSHNPPLVIPSVPGFPGSRLYQRQRMRLSVKRAARSPSKPWFLTGNLGEPRDLLCAPAPAQRSTFRIVILPAPARRGSGAPQRLCFFLSIRSDGPK